MEQHRKDLDRVLSRLEQHGLVINPGKSEISMTELEFVGHIISATGIRVDQKKSSSKYPKMSNKSASSLVQWIIIKKNIYLWVLSDRYATNRSVKRGKKKKRKDFVVGTTSSLV